jgi:hypothetical protein
MVVDYCFVSFGTLWDGETKTVVEILMEVYGETQNNDSTRGDPCNSRDGHPKNNWSVLLENNDDSLLE